jgi:K(+)-stimulated pyrophosphate-energized sodium pump
MPFLSELTPFEFISVWVTLGIALLGLGYAWLLRGQVLRKDKGSTRMQEVWSAIREGANAYLRRQLRTILPLILILMVVLFFSAYATPTSPAALRRFSGLPAHSVRLLIAFGRAAAFLLGSSFSLTVGQLGMRMAVQGNVRVASAARRRFAEALDIAYRSGAITGMLTIGLGLLGGTVIIIVFGLASPSILLGFGFGGTLLALFMRVGGGIYTKAADVGADLVGKVEQGLPEDDPRNAAVVADQVGDNVGDCAGMAADIFESYEVTFVSGLILGVALVDITGQLKWVLFPLLVRAIGVLASIAGTVAVRGERVGQGKGALSAINRGLYLASGISVAVFLVLALFYMRELRSFLSVSAGIALAIVIFEVTKHFTETDRNAVRQIASESRTGSATLILKGLAVGFEATAWQIAVIGITILAAVLIYLGQQVTFVLYGVAMTGIGILSLTGNTLAMDSYGPIVDNANGIGEMSALEREPMQILADLDAVGNTTKAVTKGVAIASAVIAAVSLFASFLTSVSQIQVQLGVSQAMSLLSTGIRISTPVVFVGMLLGGAVPWLFSSLGIDAVARASSLIIQETRRQFRLPGILEGTARPDYSRVVGISTLAAQKELLSLAIFAVLAPLIVGTVLSEEALGGFLGGVILTGQLLAVFMVTSGGSWDNAKKTIEDGLYGGKGSEPHKASVVGDTVGDPLKDTAGPALNPMIKVINIVAVLAAPVLVQYRITNPVVIVVTVVLAVLLFGAIVYSKRGRLFGAGGKRER